MNIQINNNYYLVFDMNAQRSKPSFAQMPLHPI